MDSKSEWCKALGYNIHNIRGDGNCLYTSIGKDLDMTGNPIRESIIGKQISAGVLSFSLTLMGK
eukprot:4249888-Heterocapsa_arctica.AAC.1